MKNLKIYIKTFIPYVIAGTTVVLSNKAIGNGYPIYLDKEKYNYTADIYNHDKPYTTKLYKGDMPKYDYAYVYGKWEENTNGGYDRKVLKYAIYDMQPKEVIDILDFGIVDVEDILGEPDRQIVEHKDRLDRFEEKINNESYKYIDYNEKENILTESRFHDLLVLLKEIIETSIICTSYYTYKILKK